MQEYKIYATDGDMGLVKDIQRVQIFIVHSSSEVL